MYQCLVDTSVCTSVQSQTLTIITQIIILQIHSAAIDVQLQTCIYRPCIYRRASIDVQLQTCSYRRASIDVQLQACSYRLAATDVQLQTCSYKRAAIDVHLQTCIYRPCIYRRAAIDVQLQACSYRLAATDVQLQTCSYRRAAIDLQLQMCSYNLQLQIIDVELRTLMKTYSYRQISTNISPLGYSYKCSIIIAVTNSRSYNILIRE